MRDFVLHASIVFVLPMCSRRCATLCFMRPLSLSSPCVRGDARLCASCVRCCCSFVVRVRQSLLLHALRPVNLTSSSSLTSSHFTGLASLTVVFRDDSLPNPCPWSLIASVPRLPVHPWLFAIPYGCAIPHLPHPPSFSGLSLPHASQSTLILASSCTRFRCLSYVCHTIKYQQIDPKGSLVCIALLRKSLWCR